MQIITMIIVIPIVRKDVDNTGYSEASKSSVFSDVLTDSKY